ncbi:nitroreductase/quinone reductase family protein [Pseudofrankia sp. BMG5.37]|nr:nitroreductase/quinone reductase family protein [Pseudofrankia sp. BMG5.36]MDT3445889.1 nitroreductase/quinone reductase family protein [Pseudofrankia sp. BMG5.37]OHV50681.1 nitroreductase [Pseudofrankia sp. BMG5.36]
MTMPSDMREFNRSVVTDFRANGGELSDGMLKGSRVLLLTTVGARGGSEHTTPLAFFTDGPDRLVLWASNMAAPKHPDWYANLAANPSVTVELPGSDGIDRYQATASIASGDERARLLTALADFNERMAAHQTMTEREIPLVVVERADQ